MGMDPFRQLRRRRRIELEAREEAQLLRYRHGAQALDVVRETFDRPDLTSRYRKVIARVIHHLERDGV